MKTMGYNEYSMTESSRPASKRMPNGFEDDDIEIGSIRPLKGRNYTS